MEIGTHPIAGPLEYLNMGDRAPIRVTLLDDHQLVLEAIENRLRSEEHVEVIGCASSGIEALAQVIGLQPDVAVVDVDLPGRSAFDLAAEMIRKSPRTRIIFLTGYLSDVLVEQAIRLKVASYVMKGDPVRLLIEAIQHAAAGQNFFSPQVADRLQKDPKTGEHSMSTTNPLAQLSNRQLQVLQLLANGESVKEVARAMHLSQKSVDSHKYRIMHKLGIHDRVMLARFAIREGLTRP